MLWKLFLKEHSDKVPLTIIQRINPLSANDVNSHHDADVACDGCSASYMQNQ